jgi:hypothetical protein
MRRVANMGADDARMRRHPPAAGRWRELPPFVGALVAVCAFAFLSGGYVLMRSTPIAVAALVGAAAWVWFVRIQRPSALFLLAVAAFCAFTLCVGASVAWSFGPDLTWNAFNLCLLYLALLAMLGFTPARRLQLRAVALGFVAVSTAIGLYALAGKVVPDVVTHAHTYARLDRPVGYWNVLALLMAMGITVAAAIASDRCGTAPWLRIAVSTAAVPLSFAFFFSFSRGGYVALVVCLVVYFALTTSRIASLTTLAVVGAPVAFVLWRVRGLDSLFAATTDDALRAAQGAVLLRWALLALAAVTLLQLAVVLLQRVVPWPRAARLAVGAGLLVLIVGGGAAGAALYVRDQGGADWLRGQYEAFTNDSDPRGSRNSASRVLSLNTGRPPLWREALEQHQVLPALGTGAGTFVFTHERFRESGGVVKHAHSQWLNVLSEVGLVGLLLFVAAVALTVAAAFRRLLRDRRDDGRPLLSALQAGIIAFVVHISWDWDWDMAVAGGAFVLFAGTAAAYLTTRGNDLDRAAVAPEGAHLGAHDAAPGEEPTAAALADPPPGHGDGRPPAAPARRLPLPVRVAASGLLLLAALSWMPPYLAERAAVRAISAAGSADLALAAAEAERASEYNPLAVSPLITLALVRQQQGRGREALAALRRAAELQPQDADVHYQLGLVLLRVFGRPQAAAASFRRALSLDPHDDDSAYQLELALQQSARRAE